MFADKITGSMQQCIDETERRRALQMKYNEEHGITPTAIVKARNPLVGLDKDADEESLSAPAERRGRGNTRKAAGAGCGGAKPYPDYERSVEATIAAEPVIGYLNAEELRRYIDKQRHDMLAAAKNMEFMEAARLRDEILTLEARLEKMS